MTDPATALLPDARASALGHERDTAVEAVRAAARLCRAVRARFDETLATAKDDRSPVTVADLGAQALVGRALADAFPSDPLMAEEDARPIQEGGPIAEAVLGAVRAVRPDLDHTAIEAAIERGRDEGGPGRRWWTLDPVDGTKGYLRNEQYAVALALVEDGAPVLGVLGCPNLEASGRTGWLFVAERGAGAWELPLDEPDALPRRIAVAALTDPAQARYAESVEAAHSGQDEAARIGARLGITAPPVRLDSQAKYAVVARGDASIYLRIPRGGYRENVWDHAAGVLVVQEAGGRVSDVDGLQLDFTTGRRLTANRGIVAAPTAIHHRVVEAVRSVLGS